MDDLSANAPRVLLASNFNSQKRAYNAIVYEFCKTVSEMEDADIAAPVFVKKGRRLRKVASKARQIVGLPQVPNMRKMAIEKDYDLFFYICTFPRNLSELPRLDQWRRRSRTAAAFIIESWASTLAREQAALRLLDDFDHVFLHNRASLPTVRLYTNAPCSFLPLGVDCLTASPYPNPPKRSIDVYSMGRRSALTHRQLFAMAERGEIFYIYDTFPAGDVPMRSWGQHRLLVSNLIKRSRYFVMFNYGAGGLKSRESAGHHALPARMFEGAAGGAVMIGSAPQCPEFDEHFDWPDAVIEIPEESKSVRDFLNQLNAAPERMRRLSRTNAVQSLRRHDWAYRWEQVLNHFGLQPKPELGRRKALLKRIADEAEADAV